MKNHSVGAELFHADKQKHTDGWKDSHDEADSHFSQFCNHA